MALTYAAAGRFVRRVGLAYLFGGRDLDLPNLHYQLTGREGIWEWNDLTDFVWSCRSELPAREVAWYGAWLRGRGTFVADWLLPAALGWVGSGSGVDGGLAVARTISREAAVLYEVLLTEGPLPTMALREAAGLDAAPQAYKRSLRALEKSLLITQVGAELEQGAWPSAVFELTARAFPRSRPLGKAKAIAQLVSAYRQQSPEASPLAAARLFGAPIALVRQGWSSSV